MTRPSCSPLLVALLAVLALGVGTGCKDGAPEHLERARDAVFEKRPNDALTDYRRVLDAVEKDSSAQAQLYRARALKGAADVYYLELRKFADAAKIYEELLTRVPEAPEALEARLHLADLLHVHFHDTRGAINQLTKAIAQNPPQAAELIYRVAKHYFELGDYKQCQIEAQQLVTRYETSAFVDDAMLLRAQAEAMEGKREDSKKSYTELTERFPDSELWAHALFELGKLEAEQDRPEKAIEHWVGALKRHPDPKLVQNAIARVRRRMAATTPTRVGERASAFDRGLAHSPKPAKSSAEALGISKAEAAE